MTTEINIALRLQFLARVVRKECQHLVTTDQRLFGNTFTSRNCHRAKCYKPNFTNQLNWQELSALPPTFACRMRALIGIAA